MDIATTMSAGIRERFGELLEAHRGIVLKVAGTYAWHPEDRADLAQEIAAQLWRAFPKYDEARSFATWMYRIALNVAISSVRGDGARRHAVPLDEDLHEVGIDGADHEAEQHLRLLPVQALFHRVPGLLEFVEFHMGLSCRCGAVVRRCRRGCAA